MFRYTERTSTWREPAVLMVSQYWIWNIGEMVFTSFDITNPFDKPFWNIQDKSYCSMRTRPSNEQAHNELIGVLLSNCVSSPALLGKSFTRNSSTESSVFTVFARSIALVSEEVNKYLGPDKLNDNNIEMEKKYLHEIEDIREEISMIRTVLEEQEEIWKDFSFSTWPMYWPDGPEGKFVPPTTYNDPEAEGRWKIIRRLQPQFPKFKRRLQKLNDDAERVQRSIELKLDLKARHASLREARTASVMSASVFGFTIITIIFTPLSFLVGLFALPIDQLQQNQVPFQGQEQNSTVYSTQYIGGYIGKPKPFSSASPTNAVNQPSQRLFHWL